MVVVGVLADVEGGQVQAEGGDGAADPGQGAVGGEGRVVVPQRPFEQAELGEELRGGGVVAAGLVRGSGRDPAAGVDQLGLDAGEFEPVGLLSVQLEDAAVQARQVPQVDVDRVQELLVRPGQRGRVGQDGDEPVDQADADPHGVLVLDLEDFAGDGGGDVGIAVAVPADPGAEADRGLLWRQRDAVLGKQLGEVREHFRHGVAEDAGEVIDGVPGLVHGGGPDLAELVRLPHLVDHFGQVAVLAAARGGALRRGFGQDVREPADFVQHGAAGGLGGVCGEDGADVEFVDDFLQHGVAGLVRDLLHGFGEPAVLLLPGAQPADPVDLLGGVRQVEVEREGADQVGGLLQRQGTEQFADLGDDVVRAPRPGSVGAAAGGFLGFLGQQAHLLHQVQELGAVLADQGFAEEGGDPADISPEFGGKIGVGMHCSVSHGNYLSRVRLGSYTALDTVSPITSSHGMLPAGTPCWNSVSDSVRPRRAAPDAPPPAPGTPTSSQQGPF